MTEIPPDRFNTYAEFWPYYLSHHKMPATRYLHFAGTLLALLFLAKAVLGFGFGYLVVALLSGYGMAWIGHAFIEKNHPATFEHPLWSLRADFEMLGLWLTGKLAAELAKHHVTT
jgi:hypothetical protein